MLPDAMGDPPGTVLLRRAPDLVVTLLTDGGAVVRIGERTVVGGPHTLAVLDLFNQPCSLSDALTTLKAHGLQDYIDASRLVVQFQRAGVLIDAASPVAIAPRATGFDSPSIHAKMLNDGTRTIAFFRAIEQVVREGDVVVDIGTGTGVLAIAAARAGARHVYAIESGTIALAAREIVAANGFRDRITIVHGRSTVATLPERADVLVTETIGDDPFAEGIVESVRDARRRLLRPGARVVPNALTLCVLPVDIPDDFAARWTVVGSNVERWRDMYQIDFAPLATYTANAVERTRVSIGEARGWRAVGDALTLADARLDTDEGVTLRAHTNIVIREPATHLGLLCYFDALLVPGVSLSSRPSAGDSPEHWHTFVTYVANRPCVVPGDVVRIEYSCRNGDSVIRASA